MQTTDSLAAAPRATRADARRNYTLLVAAASAAFAEHGTDASLEDIARRAGVGIGTLYRHFPTRQALAEAVFRDQIEALCTQAEDLLTAPSPADALATWLRAVVVHGTTKRGLAEFLKNSQSAQGSNLAWCKDAMRAAGAALLSRAQQAGGVRPDADIADLLKLAHAISWAADQQSDGDDRTERLFTLMMDGLRCQAPDAQFSSAPSRGPSA